MFYWLSKPAWFLTTPSNALLFAALLALLVDLFRPCRGWRITALALVALLGVAGVGPLGYMLILPLESRFEAPPAGEEPRAIVVLGGAVEERLALAHGGDLNLNEAGERLTKLLELARAHPGARLIYSGGTGEFLSNAAISEAEAVRARVAGLGLSPDRLEVETRSRNTEENARFTAAILPPKEVPRVWLVTSAYHMPRAVGVFRRAGYDPVAVPVDHRAAGWGDFFRPTASVGEGLRRSDLAAKEWVGLLVYRLSGKTDALFPAP
jgi:uncharacterized SAM-binding protein YcdF (DUF218 family)